MAAETNSNLQQLMQRLFFIESMSCSSRSDDLCSIGTSLHVAWTNAKVPAGYHCYTPGNTPNMLLVSICQAAHTAAGRHRVPSVDGCVE